MEDNFLVNEPGNIKEPFNPDQVRMKLDRKYQEIAMFKRNEELSEIE